MASNFGISKPLAKLKATKITTIPGIIVLGSLNLEKLGIEAIPIPERLKAIAEA